MEPSTLMFPDQIICPECDSALALNEDERRSATVVCPECGSAITPGGLEGNRTGGDEQLSMVSRVFSFLMTASPLRQKIFFTLGVIAVYRIGLLIPMPGVNAQLVYSAHTGIDATHRYTLFSQRLFPYLLASAFMVLLSTFVPPLKRLREGTEEHRQRFDTIIIIGTLIYSLIEAWGSYAKMQGVSIAGQPLAGGGDLASYVRYVIVAATGTLLLVWLAGKITQRGAGNGVAILMLSDFLFSSVQSFRYLVRTASSGAFKPGTTEFLVMIPLVLIVLSALLLLGKRTLRLQRIDGRVPDEMPAQEPPGLPIRVLSSGYLPFLVALWVMDLPQSYFSIRFMSPAYWAPYIAVVIIASVMLTAVTYDWKDMIARLKRYGYVIADARSDDEATALLDRLLIRTMVPGLLFVCVLASLPVVMVASFGGVATIVTKEVLIIVAISVSVVRSLRADPGSHPASILRSNPDPSPWDSVLSPDTVIEGNLAQGLLAELGIESRVIDTRVVCAAGTLGLWEVCRPGFPGTLVHPRLGKGSVDVYVREADADRARALLGERDLL